MSFSARPVLLTGRADPAPIRPERREMASGGLDAERLTIIILCDHAHISGGLAQVAHASARALRRRGHRVIFFAAVPPIDPALIEDEVEVVCLDQPDMLNDPSSAKAAGRALWNGVARRVLARLLHGLDPRRTVIHVHGWSKALSPSVLRASSRSGIAMVQTLHDYVALCPNGALFDYAQGTNCARRPLSVECVRANCDARHYAHKAWRVVRHMTMHAAGCSLAGKDVIYISERQREILEPLLPVGTHLHYVQNPVEVADLGPAPVASSEAFLFIGRLSSEKGAALFVEATARLGLEAWLIGDGPLRESLATAPQARLTGWVGNAAVVEHLRQARCLVFPSVWYETFGLSVYEALANGVPPVVSDNTTAARAIEHGVTGLLFRSGDIDDLAAQLNILTDARRAAEMGRAAYERYWQRPPTIDRHIEQLERTYRQILRHKRPPDRANGSTQTNALWPEDDDET